MYNHSHGQFIAPYHITVFLNILVLKLYANAKFIWTFMLWILRYLLTILILNINGKNFQNFKKIFAEKRCCEN